MRLKDKVQLVTGAGRGIGRAIALAMAREGAALVIADKNAETAAKTAADIRAAGGRAEPVRVDVAIASDCAQSVQVAIDAFGRIDGLVNNAGVGFHRLFLETTLEDWERLLRTNLTSAFLISQHAARHMVRQGSGRITHIGSISGQRGGTGRAAYGTAKAGLMQLTRVMAVELAPDGVAVNAIAPGPIQTDMTNHGPEQRQAYVSRIPMRRYGTPEAVAAAAVYLASDECQFVTGHTLNVDGGFGAAGLIFSLDEAKRYRSGPQD